MLPTNWRELKGALQGAVVFGATPWVLQSQVGDIEVDVWGIPLAAFTLPCILLGAVLGAYRARTK